LIRVIIAAVVGVVLAVGVAFTIASILGPHSKPVNQSLYNYGSR
jgi:hypothetical protein